MAFLVDAGGIPRLGGREAGLAGLVSAARARQLFPTTIRKSD
jgi:hypothetical protein